MTRDEIIRTLEQVDLQVGARAYYLLNDGSDRAMDLTLSEEHETLSYAQLQVIISLPGFQYLEICGGQFIIDVEYDVDGFEDTVWPERYSN